MAENEKTIAVINPQHDQTGLTAFSGPVGFEAAQRMAKALISSTMVPEAYRGGENIGNAIIALEMAQRMNASPMAVMQNLHIIEGRPSWSSSFIIAALNSCNRFSPLRFRIEDRGEKSIPYEYWDGPKGQRQKKTGTLKLHDRACIAWATDRSGEKLEGPEASMEMAVREGWYSKSGSKWQTMPDLMLRYRAAAFFGRLYAPDVLMGMHAEEEVVDMDRPPVDVTPVPPLSDGQQIRVKEEPSIIIAPINTSDAPAPRKRGEPGEGRKRRTKEEMEEDRLADERDAAAAAQGPGVAAPASCPCEHPTSRFDEETGQEYCDSCGELLDDSAEAFDFPDLTGQAAPVTGQQVEDSLGKGAVREPVVEQGEPGDLF